MAVLTLTTDAYRDKLLGCWQGKSAGATLGASLRGQRTPGRQIFYNPVPGQPVASIALDIPLVWLALFEEIGVAPVPEEMAIAWLENLDYAQEELGYAALNLLRGLPPPASGSHSNFFREASLGLGRADFWAMIAPGSPQVAAAYAYHDATIDHAEEGEWAAMFLASLLSASFFLADPFTLLTIGLAMIPRTSRSSRAVKTALMAGQRGASWLEARESVLNEVGSPNFSDAPQNLGFFVIGLLYGSGDFANTLCAGINCGYDSEMVGAALGAYMGIQKGASTLPADWTRPVGDLLIPGMGLKEQEAPLSLKALTERTLEIGKRVLAERCPDIGIEDAPVQSAVSAELPLVAETPVEAEPAPEPTPLLALEAVETPAPLALPSPEAEDEADTVESVYPNALVVADRGEIIEAEFVSTSPSPVAPQFASADSPPTPLRQSVVESPVVVEPPAPIAIDPLDAIAWTDSTLVKPLLVRNPNAQLGMAGDFPVTLNSGDSPSVAYGLAKTVSVQIMNPSPQPFMGKIALLAPAGWRINPPPGLGQRQFLAAEGGTFYGEFAVQIPEGQGRIEIANALTVRLTPDGGVPLDAEFVLLGNACWWTAGPFANYDGEGYDVGYAPETRAGLSEIYSGRNSLPVAWEKRSYPSAVLDLDPLFRGSSGVCYGQTVLRSPTAFAARLAANTNSGVKVWVNGRLVFRRHHREVFRPEIGTGAWAFDVDLSAGDNHLLVKWVRGNEPYSFSLTVSDRNGRGVPEIGNVAW